MTIDASGNLYGVTESGGANEAGTVYELSPVSGGVWTKTVLYPFSFGNTDVWFPSFESGLRREGEFVRHRAPEGGAYNAGGIFELSPGSNGTWTEKVIYNFTGGTDVMSFHSYLAIDRAGNLYGYRENCTSSSGVLSYGGIFQMQANANGTWTENILHTFSGGNDGGVPFGGRLTLDSAGNIYGEAVNGPRDFGIIFELVASLERKLE